MPESNSLTLFMVGCALLWAGPLHAETGDVRKSVAAASVEAGKSVGLRCKACHTLEKDGANKLGPNLWRIVGRPKAEVDGFSFSNAFKKLDGEWTLEELDKFLADPRGYAPGNRMAFPGLKKADQRHNLLAYLATIGAAKPEPGAPVSETKPASAVQPAAEPTLADDLGLPQGEGREEVAALCAACHSLQIVTQQGLDADRWDVLMDWMTEKQGMPELEAEERTKIVSYLAEHYGPQSRSSGTGRVNPMMPRMPVMPPQPN